MYSFTWSHPNSVKRSWETVHLRGVGNFAWGVFFLGVGQKLDEELFWQFDSFVMLKMGWVIKWWWEDSTGGENNWIFGCCGGLQSSSRENPDMYIEKS